MDHVRAERLAEHDHLVDMAERHRVADRPRHHRTALGGLRRVVQRIDRDGGDAVIGKPIGNRRPCPRAGPCRPARRHSLYGISARGEFAQRAGVESAEPGQPAADAQHEREQRGQ
jgi:hypothetical protein